MKIILFDSWLQKFTKEMVKHWQENGHQVLVNPVSEAMMEADVTFFYQADNVAVEETKKPHSGKIFVQAVDIEVWAGQANAVDWTKVDGALFLAEHIRRMVDVGNCPWQLLKPGVNTDVWTLRPSLDPKNPVRRIAYVVGDKRIWDVKRLDIAFQLLKDLIDDGRFIWQLHVRGTYSTHEQYNAYCKYLEKDLKLEGHVFWYPERIEDLNKWLDDKDFFLLPSTKEAFSYATAETMCKGIKPIINNWESSKDNWKPFVSETQGQMLKRFLEEKFEPEVYRKYIFDNFDQKRYFRQLDEFLGIKGGD